MAATEELRSLAQRNIDILLRSLDLRGVHLRADFDGFVEAVADLELFGARDKLFGEFRGDSLLQQDAAGGRAALAGGAECAPQRAVEREIEIGVVEDDLRVFAAHLERNLLEGGGGALRDQRAHRARAGEADGAHIGMLDQRRSRRRAGAADDVDHARRQARIDERLDEVVGGERRVGGGLDDAGVARDQRGKELPARNRHGEVPRRDEADHANRHAHAHGELVRQLAKGW